MSVAYNNKIVTDGLILCLDAADPKSYNGSGITWYDRSKNENHGILVNNPIYNSDNGGSIIFDGADDYVEILYDGDLSANDFTFSFFAKHNGPRDGRRTMIGLSNADQRAFFVYCMQIWGNDTQYMEFRGNNTSYESTILDDLPRPFYEWNHFTSVQTPSSSKVYLNGKILLTASTSRRGVFDRIWLGSRGEQYWKGWLPNLNLYNRALSPEEILQNYNATKGRFGL